MRILFNIIIILWLSGLTLWAYVEETVDSQEIAKLSGKTLWNEAGLEKLNGDVELLHKRDYIMLKGFGRLEEKFDTKILEMEEEQKRLQPSL